MEDYYLSLMSDSSLNIFSNNTQSSFTVRLDQPINIEKENWEVALGELITLSGVNNISKNNNFFFLSFLDQTLLNSEGIGRTNELSASGEGCHEYKIFLPEGNYNSPQHLVDEMQSVMDTKHGSLLKKINASISITYAKSTNHLNIVADPKQIRVRFPGLLGEALGANPNMSEKPIGNEEYAFKYGVDVNILHNLLYVHSDVVDYTYLGEMMAPILRVISFKSSKHSKQSHREFAKRALCSSGKIVYTTSSH